MAILYLATGTVPVAIRAVPPAKGTVPVERAVAPLQIGAAAAAAGEPPLAAGSSAAATGTVPLWRAVIALRSARRPADPYRRAVRETVREIMG
jgi:hypothetical protein